MKGLCTGTFDDCAENVAQIMRQDRNGNGRRNAELAARLYGRLRNWDSKTLLQVANIKFVNSFKAKVAR